ncbi:MAG: ABC transporter ATP-binding protein [Nitrososphaerales archaeon]
MPNLQIENLSSGYGDLHVLEDLSFTVQEGQIVSLIGANGAGKTTLLKTIAGLIRPSSGRIMFGNTILNKIPIQKIVESGVVYVPEGRGVFPDMSVSENLEMGAYTKHAREFNSKNLEKVYSLFPALKERKKQLGGTLSGGQSQMLAIGRGLMSNPQVLLLDEPSAGISPIISESIFESISKLPSEGITVLMVEQDAGRSLRLSNRAHVLENGKIILSGEGKELLDNNHVREAYLGA